MYVIHTTYSMFVEGIDGALTLIFFVGKAECEERLVCYAVAPGKLFLFYDDTNVDICDDDDGIVDNSRAINWSVVDSPLRPGLAHLHILYNRMPAVKHQHMHT